VCAGLGICLSLLIVSLSVVLHLLLFDSATEEKLVSFPPNGAAGWLASMMEEGWYHPT